MRSVLTAPVLCFFVFCSLPAPGAAQTLRAEALTAPPPAELAPGVRERLADRGVKATAGDVTIELWWVKALPVSKDAAWSGVREGSLVGAVRLSVGCWAPSRARKAPESPDDILRVAKMGAENMRG